MGIWAVFRGVLAALHQVEEADDGGIDGLFVGVATVFGGEATLAESVVVAGVLLEVVVELALAASRAEIFIVKFLAGVLVGLRAGNLPADVV